MHAMAMRQALVVALLMVVAIGGGTVAYLAGERSVTAAEPAAAARRAIPAATRPVAMHPPTAADGLKGTLQLLLGEIERQESGKDATCWTTVRMMDTHFAGRPISDAVAVLKIEACKTLVYHLWRAASSRTRDGSLVGAAEVDAALPEATRATVALMVATEPAFGTDPVRSVMNRDYHRITENRRYLIGLVGEALTHTGLFEGREPKLAPLAADGVAHLAAAATVLTTGFLDECGKLAAAKEHESITAEDVREIFARQLDAFGPGAAAEAQPALNGTIAAAVVDADLLAASRRLIDGKISALRAWNAKVWKDADEPRHHQHQQELVNRLSKVPFSRLAFEVLVQRMQRYADYLALGIAPPQRNLMLAPVNLPDFSEARPAVSQRERYVTLAWATNAIENLYPREIAANGDVTITLVGDPGRRVPDQDRRVRLLDWDLDALRDTTLHWSVMRQAWIAADARPADPFALEILADRMSELELLFIRECEAVALQNGMSEIDDELVRTVLKDVQFAVPAPRPSAWGERELAAKQQVLDGYQGPLFRDLSADGGFPRVAPPDRAHIADGQALVDYMGSGVAVGDIDGDGLPDLFLPGDGGNRLLRNLGGHRFEDVTERLGVVDPGIADAHHALFVDYDNDGRLDLFVVHSQGPSRLFHQEADGHFTDVTATCGIVTGATAHDAVWFDYDNDGLLDCYVGHYGKGRPSLDGRNGERNRLFHNLGNGHFEDVTDKAGVGSTGWTLACAAIDVDGDGWMDLFVGNDYGRSELYRNNGDGTFTECGARYGVDDRGSTMNASVVDVTGGPLMDLYTTQIDMFSKSVGFVLPRADDIINVNERILKSTFSISGNKLYRNDGGRRFASVEEAMFEPGDRGWSWSGNFFDYDNDGDDDLYLTNGWLDGTPAANQKHQFFIRDGGRFYLADPDGPECYASNARGAVAADLTGSGRVDLVVNDFGGQPRLLANACTNANQWLKVKLRGTRSNRFGVDAVVEVARPGGLRQRKQVNCGANYLSQDETTLTFGLGAAKQADGITVTWPGNHVQVLAGPFTADSTVEVVEDR
jgi:hypothetical protein